MTKSFHESRPTHHNRRHALAAGVATTSLAALGPPVLAQQQQRQADDKRNRICAFIKFVQDLPYDELAERIAEMGFDGIEATVRNGGHVLPERVEDDLPKLVEALEKHGLEISVMASNVNSVKQPLTEKVLRTAARLGVRTYRMGYYRYDAKRPV
ncbi:MAG: hypothetical protein QF805_27615, partial [Pirellulaceae bacterium]|nr:hypothetical protein [Pirellulaceae bacterium]